MKKSIKVLLLCTICCILFAIAASASSTFSSVTKSSSSSVTSSAVGLGTKASYYARCYDSSSASMSVSGQAAWDGWPYTTEVSTTLKAGQKATLSDTQGKSSSFRIKLSGSGTGVGTVTLISQ
jgi:hypothetical protein